MVNTLSFTERKRVRKNFGDLKENAEYHAAKEQQSLTEARIRDW